MNKKFSTLLAGLALTTAFSANATNPVDKQLHQLKVGDKYLSVTKSKVNTAADSLILVSTEDVGEDVMKDSFKKSLWKLTKGHTDNTTNEVWTLTNWATGNVLSLDLTKSTTTFTEGKQSEWLIEDNGYIKAISNGKTYAIYTEDVKDKDDKVVGTALKIGKDKSFANFSYYQPKANNPLKDNEINGLYGTSSVFDFEKDLNGNPIDGVAIKAVAIEGETDYVNIRLNDGKYLVVDSTKWTNSVNSNNYWKLTTDAMPSEVADKDEKSTDLATIELLKNGRSADFYAFRIDLNIAEGYKMTITPKAVPVYTNTNEKEGKQTAFSFGSVTTTRALVYGKFADSKEVIAATSSTEDNLKNAVATFGVVEAPDALDTDYTYYVQFYNKKKISSETDNWISDANYNKYVYVSCDNDKAYVKTSAEAPAYMWFVDENGVLKNMINMTEQYTGFITLISEENGIYAFGTDTLKLTKGPKIADARNMGYKVVTKADEVNGALSFRLVSVLADDLYMISKDGVMYVANSELNEAQELKVEATEIPNEDDQIEYATVGNKVVKPVYRITDRLGKKVLVLEDEKFKLVDREKDGVTPLMVSFLSMGKNNQYKIVYGENSAITANAASGILAETTLCDDQNVIFEFATKDAPTYGAPAIGHVQITTMEDDNKVIANQKDGFAALKAEGQILRSDVYTQDTLTMWLDTASVTFDETMPLYYLSTKTFTPEAETRNFLINPANISAAIEANNDDPDAEKIENIYDYSSVAGENTYRAAFIAASVCGLDSIAIDGDTIDVLQLNPAAIAFEVAAEVSDEAYRIVSKLHASNPDYDAEDEESLPYEETETTLYLAQLNNVLFWTDDQVKAEIFLINRASTPTSNENVADEVSGVSVIGGNGTVTVQGAAGKSVVITNILGKVVAETVLTSDNATISVPAGIIAVAVEGEEAVKTVVK
ncbi:DUF6383 domain-containing protein [uncultured Parabacteroides sp.]|uniref:DUF6383 domain-containing protein n=1 Tax=uncultured Parabacteroides sp. TaxID=512312 RepID=UPI00261F24DA|nr:DUF6383 domain-containing protein [uncultured Parabacteroides sp.]